jgi:5-methylthioadenosine/S-adenosylhomocysteine deaminase
MNRLLPLASALLLTFACAATTDEPRNGPGDGPAAEVLLVTGGTVVTMDADRTVLADGAVAVSGADIAAVGPAADLAARYPDARRIDATGKIVLPGLVNAHEHVPMSLLRGLADDLALQTWLERHIFPAEAAFVDEKFVRVGTRLSCLELLRGGVTTVVDMYYFEGAIAEEIDRCGLRGVLGQTVIGFPAPDYPTWDEAVAGAEEFVTAWKGHSRVTPAVAPHAPYTLSDEQLEAAHALAERLDVPLLIHVSETQTELETIRKRSGTTPVHYLDGLGVLTDRMVAAHMVWPTDDEIPLLATRGVGAVHNPQSNMKLASGVAPIGKLLAAGVDLGLGTDGPASNNDQDLWREMDSAAKLQKVTTGDPTALPAEEAFALATIGGARALDMEDAIGSLEPGKRADLVVVGTDAFHQVPQDPTGNPYSLLVYATHGADVELVMVDGKVVVRDGQVLTLDGDAVIAAARALRREIDGTSAEAQ